MHRVLGQKRLGTRLRSRVGTHCSAHKQPISSTSILHSGFKNKCVDRHLLHYYRQGRKVEDLRSRGNTRTQRAHSTGTNIQPTAPNASNIVTNDHFTSVYIGNLSPWQHLTACSPCQEVGTTTIHRQALAQLQLFGCNAKIQTKLTGKYVKLFSSRTCPGLTPMYSLCLMRDSNRLALKQRARAHFKDITAIINILIDIGHSVVLLII